MLSLIHSACNYKTRVGEKLSREQEVGGSNPLAPTSHRKGRFHLGSPFLFPESSTTLAAGSGHSRQQSALPPESVHAMVRRHAHATPPGFLSRRRSDHSGREPERLRFAPGAEEGTRLHHLHHLLRLRRRTHSSRRGLVWTSTRQPTPHFSQVQGGPQRGLDTLGRTDYGCRTNIRSESL